MQKIQCKCPPLLNKSQVHSRESQRPKTLSQSSSIPLRSFVRLNLMANKMALQVQFKMTTFEGAPRATFYKGSQTNADLYHSEGDV